MIDFELREGVRVVREFSNFVILAPYASSSPFELRLFPKRHSHDFALMDDSQLAELAVAMKDMLLRIKVVLRMPPTTSSCIPHRRCTAVPVSPATGIHWSMIITGTSSWCRV
jgi:galactose-1-phosphate uridylyltransferase